jgi:hypothetical protein
MGMTGSGSTDSSAPSPTNAKIDIDTTIDTVVDIAVPTVIDNNAKIDIDTTIDIVVDIVVPTVIDNNAKIDINTTIDTVINIAVPTVIDNNAKIDINSTINATIGIAVPAIIDANPSEPEVDIAGSTIIGTASPSTTGLTPAATVVDPTSGTAGVVLTVTGGFDMAFGLFNFRVDNDGAMELISISDSAPPTAETSTPPAVEGKPPTNVLLAPSEEESRPKALTPSVGSNDFEEPPPSPTTAYYVDCTAYHYVGAGDFSSHEITGY